MGTWDRELAVISLLGRGVTATVRGLFKLLFGLGRSRWRIMLPLLASVGAIAYIGLVWHVDRFLRDVLTVTFGIPAPGTPLAPGTWIAPQNGLWPDIMQLSRIAMSVAGLVMVVLVARTTLAPDDVARRQALKRMGRPVAMVIATWTILPFALHLTNQLARALAPRSEQLLNAVGATAASGVVLIIVTWIQPLFVAIGALATLLLRAIIMIGFVFWPLACALRALDHDVMSTLGRSVTASFTVAVTAKFLQAIFAGILVMLVGSIDAWWLRPVVFVVGVIFVFIALPAAMLRYAERVVMLPLRFAPSEQQTKRYVQRSADRVGQVQSHVASGRERVNEWRESTPRQTQLSDYTDDERWWNSWIDRTVTFHQSDNWTAQQPPSADGGPGPESEDPDTPPHRDEASDRDRSRWYRQ